jgi:tetratricopeptide (TPR) repeat protein
LALKAKSYNERSQILTTTGAAAQVVEICQEHEDEPSVVGDALGIIADIYTDMGDMEQAAEYYDKYLQSMNYD